MAAVGIVFVRHGQAERSGRGAPSIQCQPPGQPPHPCTKPPGTAPATSPKAVEQLGIAVHAGRRSISHNIRLRQPCQPLYWRNSFRRLPPPGRGKPVFAERSAQAFDHSGIFYQ